MMLLLLALGCAFERGWADGCTDAEAAAADHGAADCDAGLAPTPELEPIPATSTYEEGLEAGWQECYGPAYLSAYGGAGC